MNVNLVSDVTSNRQLTNISNELHAADINRAGNLIVLDLQSQTVAGNTTDRAPLPYSKDSFEILCIIFGILRFNSLGPDSTIVVYFSLACLGFACYDMMG